MTWTRRRFAYIACRNVGPPANLAIGYHIAIGAWWSVVVILAFYMMIMTVADVLFWSNLDDAERTTRKKLEAKLGVTK